MAVYQKLTELKKKTKKVIGYGEYESRVIVEVHSESNVCDVCVIVAVIDGDIILDEVTDTFTGIEEDSIKQAVKRAKTVRKTIEKWFEYEEVELEERVKINYY